MMPSEVGLVEVANAHLANGAALSPFDATASGLAVASASLRFLLVEDMLARAWRASRCGGPMVFRTWGIASTQGDDVVAYCGGGDLLPGIPFSMCRNAKLAEITLDLEAFRHRPRIQVGVVRVSTVQLVQYVANTRGGSHFDPEGRSPRSRKPAFELLRTLDAGGIGIGLGMLVNDRNLLQHELLSVAQSLVRSPQVARLRSWTIGRRPSDSG